MKIYVDKFLMIATKMNWWCFFHSGNRKRGDEWAVVLVVGSSKQNRLLYVMKQSEMA
jgi:hypothetical protein